MIGLTLTDEEIRKLHATPPNLPPTALGGPCRCPVCDPALHKPRVRTAVVDN